jgi:hypothetical protein
MATTPNYGWVFPDPTDLVKDLPADFEIFADAVDADLADLLGGATGTVLAKASAADHDFSWINPPGYTQIATGTFSGASVSLTSIPNTYRNLELVVRGFQPATDGATLQLRFNNDSTANRYFGRSAGSPTQAAFGSAQIAISPSQDNGTTTSIVRATIFDYANTTTWKMLQSNAIMNDNTTPANYSNNIIEGGWNQTSAITEINLLPSSGNFTAGTYFLFGVR